jgi:deoxyribonuclease V
VITAAFDVHYPVAGGAYAAVVVGADERFAAIVAEHVVFLPAVAAYQPGSFFARELPALRAALAIAGNVDLLVIDGYVDLDPHGRPGLGAHLHTATGLPVIGVAKTAFRTATHARAVLRGSSAKPLYVTVAGFDLDGAVGMVRSMAGSFRLPDALRRVDALARREQASTPSTPSTPST